MKGIIVLPQAELDLKDSISYYKEHSEELGKDFIKEISLSFSQIQKNGEAFPIVKFDIRKFVVNKFPFCIYFVDETDFLYILAIFHDKRNPKSWLKRRLINHKK